MKRLCCIASTAGAAMLLSACQTCPPLRASWYEHDGTGSDKHRVMTLVVLNPGRAPFLPDGLTLNPVDEQGQGGWSLKLNRRLDPGEFRALPVNQFKDDNGKPFPTCRVPVRLAVHCTGQPQPGWAHLEGLPEHLPQQWIEDCPHEQQP